MGDSNKDSRCYFLTETTVKGNISADEILRHLKSHRTTGVVTFNLVEGGIRSITVGERRQALIESDTLRDILGSNGIGGSLK